MSKTVTEKKLTSAEVFLLYDVHLESKTLYMGPSSEDIDVDSDMLEKVIKGLHLLDMEDSDTPITIKMRNWGGCCFDGLGIYDAIKECESEVHIKVYSGAMSMGSIILQAADKRIMCPNAVLMIHDGTSGYGDSHITTIKNWIKFEDKHFARMDEILLEKIQEKDHKMTMTKLKKLTLHDTILNSEQALELGLVDEIS